MLQLIKDLLDQNINFTNTEVNICEMTDGEEMSFGLWH